MKYSILINTCDKFEDCWEPFFKLWSIYWPNCSGKIYLNTEYKEFSYPGIDITSVKCGQQLNLPSRTRATWSQCLRQALKVIDTDIVLYMQEDYFLNRRVQNDIVEHFVHLMHQHEHIKCIHLTDQSVTSCGKSPYKKLNICTPIQRYRVCCQAALWRKDELINLLRDDENAWEFEEYGSWRSSALNHDYYVVDTAWVRQGEYEIIPYIFTGIVQGRWFRPVTELFATHNINIDYNRRGFHTAGLQKPLLQRIKFLIQKFPRILQKRYEVTQMTRLKNDISRI